jgi:hypothetical protein
MNTTFKRNIIISSSIILGSFMVAALTLSYFTNAVAAKALVISADRSLISKQIGSLVSLSTLKAEQPQVAVYKDAIDSLLPTDDGVLDFSQWVNGIAANDQVVAVISFTNTTNPASATKPGTTSFSIDATGSESAILAFMNDIESKSPGYLIKIAAFDLTYNNPGYEFKGQGTVFSRQ